jgi:hypothetical protein
MNIRDLVRDLIMDQRRELLPDDGELLSRMQRLRFTSVSHRSRLRAKVNRIWLDADQAEYMTKLTEDVDAARLRFMPVLRDVQKCAFDLKGLAPEVLDVRAFSGRMQALVPEPLVAFGADGTESFPRFMRNLIGESGISYASGEIRMPVEMHTARKAIESYRHVTAMATPVREALNRLMAAMERVVSDCSEILKIGREVWDCILPSWLRRREKMILAARGRRAEAEALRSKQDEEEKLLRAAEAAERERAVSERAATAAAAAAASRARAEQLAAAARVAEQREAAARAHRIERWRTDASAMVDEALQSARDSEQSNDLLGALSQLNALALCTGLRMNTPHSKSLRQRVIVERDRVRTKIGGTVPHYID